MNANRAKLLERIRQLLEQLPPDREPVLSIIAARHLSTDDRTSVFVGHDSVAPDVLRFALSAVAQECVKRGADIVDVLDAGELETIPLIKKDTKPS